MLRAVQNYFQSSNRVQLCLSGGRNVRNYLDETKGNPFLDTTSENYIFVFRLTRSKRGASGWMRWRVRQRNSNCVYMYVCGQLSVVWLDVMSIWGERQSSPFSHVCVCVYG